MFKEQWSPAINDMQSSCRVIIQGWDFLPFLFEFYILKGKILSFKFFFIIEDSDDDGDEEGKQELNHVLVIDNDHVLYSLSSCLFMVYSIYSTCILIY